ncbi:MAG: hypothetical protein CW694_00330 [Candidatus Syntrophoarchaeum sp. WYZ-LMO15]|nr:MAG: hypothetical protein CW694_00330 [Candidatus Syntrophoarchaeum sp. WYZ-LMO15]
MRRSSRVVSILAVILLAAATLGPWITSAHPGHWGKGARDQIEATRARLNLALNHTIAYLDVIKSRIEMLEARGENPPVGSDDLQADIDELESLKLELEKARSKEEILAVARDLGSTWVRVRGDARYAKVFIMQRHLSRNLERMEEFSERMNDRIRALERRGVDARDLRLELSRFNHHIEAARDEYNRGVWFYEKGDLVNANRCFRDAYHDLIAAKNILKPLIRAYMRISE